MKKDTKRRLLSGTMLDRFGVAAITATPKRSSIVPLSKRRLVSFFTLKLLPGG